MAGQASKVLSFSSHFQVFWFGPSPKVAARSVDHVHWSLSYAAGTQPRRMPEVVPLLPPEHISFVCCRYTAPTDAALAYDVGAIKTFGLNMIRLHQKINSERWCVVFFGSVDHISCFRFGRSHNFPCAGTTPPTSWASWSSKMRCSISVTIRRWTCLKPTGVRPSEDGATIRPLCNGRSSTKAIARLFVLLFFSFC